MVVLAGEIHLMVADGDSSIRNIIVMIAKAEGWKCDEAADGIAALKRLRHREYQMVILDTDLPELDGKIVCRHIRKSSRIPIIFIGKSGTEEERLEGFAVGGNDYLVRPFYPRELVARIKNLFWLINQASEIPKIMEFGGIRLDLDSHAVLVEKRRVQLTPKEYDLLVFFSKNPGQAFSRDALLNMVWGHEFFGSDRTVDTHVKSLRSKIHPLQHYVETIWGFGYKFSPPSPKTDSKGT